MLHRFTGSFGVVLLVVINKAALKRWNAPGGTVVQASKKVSVPDYRLLLEADILPDGAILYLSIFFLCFCHVAIIVHVSSYLVLVCYVMFIVPTAFCLVLLCYVVCLVTVV